MLSFIVVVGRQPTVTVNLHGGNLIISIRHPTPAFVHFLYPAFEIRVFIQFCTWFTYMQNKFSIDVKEHVNSAATFKHGYSNGLKTVGSVATGIKLSTSISMRPGKNIKQLI